MNTTRAGGGRSGQDRVEAGLPHRVRQQIFAVRIRRHDQVVELPDDLQQPCARLVSGGDHHFVMLRVKSLGHQTRVIKIFAILRIGDLRVEPDGERGNTR